MRAGSAQIRYSNNIESRNIWQRLFISSLPGYPGFCLFSFSCFPAFLSGFFSTRGMEGGPAECLYQQNSDQCTAAVNTHIPYRRSAGIYKGLMIFIQTCKSHAYYSYQEHQPDSPDSVNVEREGNGDGKKTVFCHMSCLTDIKLDAGSLLRELIRAFASGKYFVFRFYDLVADFIA